MSFSRLLKLIIVLFLLFTATVSLRSQKQQTTKEIFEDTTRKIDIIDIVKSKFKFSPKTLKRSPGKKVYFSLLPISSAMPGGGRALITSTSAGFYLGSRSNTFLSNVTFSPYLNFKGRNSIAFRSNIYTKENLWNIQGDTRFSLYPEYIYATKNTIYRDEKLLLNYKYIRFYQAALRRIKPYFFAGVGYDLDYHININSVNDTIGLQKFTGYNHGTDVNQNTLSSGITVNLQYDTRNNAINPLPGAYANLIYRVNPSFLGNGSHAWKSLYLDGRKYINFPDRKRKVVALWSYLWTAFNNDVPYLDLPANGADVYQRSARGIDQNRYRGKSLWYIEGEYRRDITMNGLLGYVLFTNLTTITNPATQRLSGPHAAAGGGLRIKFNKRSGTNIAIDYGFSKGHSGIYLNLGEAF
ncbi:BamA/TamA family outer membrane protein [Segetibacter koreensis]|uniref:BamA/TamA family outer membrane protein n=1 Tax=Segetibacter koreensis TaxID=398037 RepID=UPI0003814590|nr:BamA/TamA family outer membrane protein [Segetibacter koreensis]